MTAAELRKMARRLLERDCAAQDVEVVVTAPEELAVVAALMRPLAHLPESGGGHGAT
jgi:hypothetical protein